ncbi:hypothetical protein Tco_1340917 [Tanacetum coccineum]
MELYIQGKEHGWIILNSVENDPLVWPTVEQEDGTVRLKTYLELSDKEKLQVDCDLKATNIVLQGRPPDVYSLVNHHKVAKDIWDRVKQLMQGTSLSKQERECKLYDEFDKFSHVKGETLHQYYLRKRFAYVDYDQLYAYLEQHEAHANEACLMHERFPNPLALVSKYHQPLSHFNNYHSQYTTPQYSSNLRNQATVQDGRVTIQQVQGKQGQNIVGSGSQGNASCSQGNTSGQAKEKVLLVQAHAEGKELDEEQLAFLADPRVADDQVA